MTRVLLTAVFLEIGVVLVIAPWTMLWDRNYFAETLPLVDAFVTNYFVRGAVSGLGFVNLYVGLAELVGLISISRSERPASLMAPTGQPEE